MKIFFSWLRTAVFKKRVAAHLPAGEELVICNEQVPWLLLKERRALRALVRGSRRMQLIKPQVDLSRWPGHGAPFLRKD